MFGTKPKSILSEATLISGVREPSSFDQTIGEIHSRYYITVMNDIIVFGIIFENRFVVIKFGFYFNKQLNHKLVIIVENI